MNQPKKKWQPIRWCIVMCRRYKGSSLSVVILVLTAFFAFLTEGYGFFKTAGEIIRESPSENRILIASAPLSETQRVVKEEIGKLILILDANGFDTTIDSLEVFKVKEDSINTSKKIAQMPFQKGD